MTREEEQLFQAIEILTQGSLPYDQTKRGRITEKLQNHLYQVQIQDKQQQIKSMHDFYKDDIVLVLFPQGNGNSDSLYLYPKYQNVTHTSNDTETGISVTQDIIAGTKNGSIIMTARDSSGVLISQKTIQVINTENLHVKSADYADGITWGTF